MEDVSVKIEPLSKFDGVYRVTLEDGSNRIASKNLAPGRDVYGERLIRYGDAEYRVWDPYRSKIAAAILKGLKTLPIKPGYKVLYLGAASGTTASHVSDIVGEEGHVFCIEFAPRPLKELINNACKYRTNMSPILADARLPEKYANIVEKVDFIYCDIAQPEQAQILVDNAKIFLKRGGWIMLAIKARSIDVTKEPSEIYRREIDILERNGFQIHQVVHLEPYDIDHAMILARYMPDK
ncbi:MAG: fibrillarin-like rRNA/tRNA 2'-O-methyltransferase [Candidatus Bathyarchaeota archaeon]|nr:fibrillarin-like rRNA/tRNA 2'-O-methyltransferase [Candidatus Bathyarchaeota archaeon]